MSASFFHRILVPGAVVALLMVSLASCASTPASTSASTAPIPAAAASSTRPEALPDPQVINADIEARLSRNPDDADARTAKAVSLRLEGRDPEAAVILKAVLKANPDHAAAATVLGQIYLEADHIDQALSLFKVALAKEPGNADADAGFGRCHLRKGNYEEAAAAFSRAMKLIDDPWLYVDRAVAMGAISYADQSEADFAIALARLGQDPYILLDRGRMRLRNRRFDKAVEDFGTILALRPDFTLARHYRAQALDLLGNAADAITDYEAVLKARPDYQPAREPLAVLYIEQGRHAEAAPLFKAGWDQIRRSERSLLLACASLQLAPAGSNDAAARDLARSVEPLLDRNGILYQICRLYVDSRLETQVIGQVQSMKPGTEKALAQVLVAAALRRNGRSRAAEDMARLAMGTIDVYTTEGRLAALIGNEPPSAPQP